ncbi:MAG: GTPase HflX [Phycisphaerales bacterium]|nr:GTPase HflX [Phycisphaerales bacterium]
MPQPKERQDIRLRQERAVLVALHTPGYRFDERDPLGELRALAETAGTTPVAELLQRKDHPDPGTFLGSGKLDELKTLCEESRAGVVIFDNLLSPSQIAAIEKTVERKVIDRCELILDIFASRATTRQAKLAVELAQLEYTYPRLRAMWSHLERIVGPGGIAGVGTRGPGEQQLEIDRRLAQRRATMLRRELEDIHARKRREVSSRNAQHFAIGLVGYTNAGKSTLFNALTAGGAYADDKLFATLMTRTREWEVDRAVNVMLSDTVGFIRDLPHNLVASFKATLEEATHADALLIVLDVSDPAAELQYETVSRTLDELEHDAAELDREAGRTYIPAQRIVLLNKADKLRDPDALVLWGARVPNALPYSALHPTEQQRAALVQTIRNLVAGPTQEVQLAIPLHLGRLMQDVERQGHVLSRSYEHDSAIFTLRIGRHHLDRLVASGASLTQ